MIDLTVPHFSYLWPSIIGGVGVALLAGPFGALMVWRRLAYFGDTLSHSGLLGVTLALALHMNVTLGICFIAILVAMCLLSLQTHSHLASDTVLGLLSHTTLALGLLALSLFDHIRVDVLGFLYGDILAMTWRDVISIYLGGLVMILILVSIWSSLLRITLHTELAQVEGVKVNQVQAIYLLLLAILVAIAIKIVGVLLITALLIIPGASARPFAKSPSEMAMVASLIGAIAVLLGIGLSHFYDVPTGPAIVVMAAAQFACLMLIKKI